MDFKSGSQVRQILRNSIKFQSSDTEGMSRETSYKNHLIHLNLLSISLLFQLFDICFLHYMMSSNSSRNIDDLSDVRKSAFNCTTTHFIQQKPNRLQITKTIFFTRALKLAKFLYANFFLNFELSKHEFKKEVKKFFGTIS